MPFRLAGGLSTGAVYALVALGYTLVYGVLHLINFAHSEVFMIGSLAGFLAISAMAPEGSDSQIQGALILAAAFIPAALAGGITALAVERIAYRPLRKRGAAPLAYLISAIGASLFLSELVRIWRGPNNETFPPSLRSRIVLDLGDTFFTSILPEAFHRVRIQNRDIIVFLVAMTMMVAVDQFINRSHSGRGIRAVAEDPATAGLMGVDINKVITVTFLIGGMLGVGYFHFEDPRSLSAGGMASAFALSALLSWVYRWGSRRLI